MCVRACDWMFFVAWVESRWRLFSYRYTLFKSITSVWTICMPKMLQLQHARLHFGAKMCVFCVSQATNFNFANVVSDEDGQSEWAARIDILFIVLAHIKSVYKSKWITKLKTQCEFAVCSMSNLANLLMDYYCVIGCYSNMNSISSLENWIECDFYFSHLFVSWTEILHFTAYETEIIGQMWDDRFA